MLKPTNRVRLEAADSSKIKIYLDDKPINKLLFGDAIADVTAFEFEDYFIILVPYDYFEADAKFLYLIKNDGNYIEEFYIDNMKYPATLHIDKYENNLLEFSYTENKHVIYKFKFEFFKKKRFIFRFRTHGLMFLTLGMSIIHSKWLPLQTSYYKMQLKLIKNH
ncbi:MAG: hypothetical protein K0R14_177 [Burkholderiales bacterium]|jgi:hypothetical protein|nr:hypothetical protein [Burkholderiales bacterium]